MQRKPSSSQPLPIPSLETFSNLHRKVGWVLTWLLLYASVTATTRSYGCGVRSAVNSHSPPGDTLYGYLDSGKRQINTMPRNSLSLVKVEKHQPVHQQYYVKTDVHNPKDESLGFFTPIPTPNQTTWFWTYDALSYGRGLYVMASEVGTISGPPPWNFATFSSGVVYVDDSTGDPFSWKYKYVSFPHTKELVALWNGFSTDDRYVYLTGYHDGDGNSPSILARIERDAFKALRFEEIEYWSTQPSSPNTGWNKYSEGIVLSGLFANFPPYTIRYHPYLKQWYTVSLLTFAFDVYLLTAPEITGPWTSTKIYDIPAPWNQKGIFCYSVLSHPELETKSNEIVFSFMSNGPWDDLLPNLWLYVPQFVRVDVQPSNSTI